MPPSNIKDIHNPHPLYLTLALLIEKAMNANSLIKIETVYKLIFNKLFNFIFVKYNPELIIKRTSS